MGYLLWLAWAMVGTTQAKVPLVDSALGYGLDGAIHAIGASGLPGTEFLARVTDFEAQKKVEIAVLQLTLRLPELRYAEPQVVLIAGQADVQNAFSTGPSILVTLEMARSLTLRQLTAVLAHEMAHAEEGHLLQRIGHTAFAPLLHLGRLIRSDARALAPGGRADEFMRELWSQGHLQTIMNSLHQASAGQELQADCIAWQWLSRISSEGARVSEQDLLASIEAAIGVSAEMLLNSGEPEMENRVLALLYGAHADAHCW